MTAGPSCPDCGFPRPPGADMCPQCGLTDGPGPPPESVTGRIVARDPDYFPRFRVRNGWGAGQPRPRRWLIDGWLPRARVVLLTGEGNSGKSPLALQVATAVAATNAVPDIVPARGTIVPQVAPGSLEHGESPSHRRRVLYLTWEDEPEEIARRLDWQPPGADGNAVGPALEDRFTVLDVAGCGPLWGPAPGKHAAIVSGKTKVGHDVEEYVREYAPALVIIDPLAGAYGGNENDRAAVRAFMSHWGRLAQKVGCAVLIVAHPPKASTALYSGSSDWWNAARGLWTLSPEPVPGLLYEDGKGKSPARGIALTRAKASYAASGARTWLRFRADGFGTPGTPRLHWEGCTPTESAQAWHAKLGLPEPHQKGNRARAKAKADPSGGLA